LAIKVDLALSSKGMEKLYDQVLAKIVLGKSDNIEDATGQLTKPRKILTEIKLGRELTRQQYEELVKKLEQKLHGKDDIIELLEKRVDDLIRILQNTKTELKIFEKIRLKLGDLEEAKIQIDELKITNQLLKKFRKIEELGMIPVLEIDRANGSLLEMIDKNLDLHNRVLFVKQPTNLNILNSFKIKAIFIQQPPSEQDLSKLEFPLLLWDEAKVKVIDGVKTLERKILEDLLNDTRKTSLSTWLENYRRRQS
jgi:hypothetical protein